MPKQVRYYECAAEFVPDTEFPENGYWRPIIERHMTDVNGQQIGRLAPVEQDSDTEPTSFVVKVINTPLPTAGNPNPISDPTVHVECAKTGTHLGNGFAEAKAKLQVRFGAARAFRMQRNEEPIFPGE